METSEFDAGRGDDADGAPAEAKLAENQVRFRKVNEGIRAVVDGRDVVLPVVPFVCECSDVTCRRLVNVPLEQYAAIRESPRRFLHALDHVQDGTTGVVVEMLDGFAIVEKTGASAEVAESDGGASGDR